MRVLKSTFFGGDPLPPLLGVHDTMQRRQELEDNVVSAVRALAKSVNSGRKAVADMSTLVETTSCLPLSNLDYWERLIRCEFCSASKFSDWPRWRLWRKPAPVLAWVNLCSGDGYKREETLRTLTGAAPNSFFFALAVRRLNDWVPQVREAAKEKLPLIARASDPVHVVDALCITLATWGSWERLEQLDRQALLDVVSIREFFEALKLRIVSAVSGPMTTILAQLGRTPAIDDALPDIAVNAIQPSVRAKAYRNLLEGKATWFEGSKWEWVDVRYCKGRLKPITSERSLTVATPFLQTLKVAAVDRSPTVRRVAAEMLIRELDTLGEEALHLAKVFAADASPSVAERGVFALKRIDEKNV